VKKNSKQLKVFNLFKGAQLQDKVVVFDVYEKLIKDSDDAYSKV
jgi:hypothetical protein